MNDNTDAVNELSLGGVGGIPKRPQLITSYVPGPAGDGKATLYIGGSTIKVTGITSVDVFQFSEHDRRLWLNIQSRDGNGGEYILGSDDSCHFGMARSVPL